jgi:hypothetical protein
MNMYRLLLPFTLFVCNFGYAQNLVSAKFLGSQTKGQITATFNIPFIDYGAKFYKIEYTSVDAKGLPDTLSGLLVVPDDNKKKFPMLYYQHGTSDCKTCVPSRFPGAGGDEGQLGLLFAGMGFTSLLPDYVGMGDGRGFQTYVHANTIASASLDMYDAVKSWLNGDGKSIATVNDQMFLTGYSQGGYGSMALHKAMETSRPDIKVTATSHLSGPYSLSGVMRDLMLGDQEFNFPAYLPNTVLGFNEIDGQLFAKIDQFFKSPYAAEIEKYYKGTQTLTSLNNKLITLLKANNNNKLSAGAMIIDSVKQVLLTNLNHPANLALKANDLHNWAPKAPTKIFYCKADDQVPYLNSVTAKDTMTALGAINLEVRDVLTTGNHGTCFNPAVTNTVLFFLGFRSITSDIQDVQEVAEVSIFPNPTQDYLAINGAKIGTTVDFRDINGRLLYTYKITSDREILSLFNFVPGFYNLTITNSKGVTSLHKLEKF